MYFTKIFAYIVENSSKFHSLFFFYESQIFHHANWFPFNVIGSTPTPTALKNVRAVNRSRTLCMFEVTTACQRAAHQSTQWRSNIKVTTHCWVRDWQILSEALVCLRFLVGLLITTLLPWLSPQRLQLNVLANCGSLASSFHFLRATTLRRTFFAVQGSEGESSRQDRKWISVPISSRAPNSDPRRLSNTMFYKLMFLEVRQGYPQPLRKRHTSSVSPKASDPQTLLLEAVLTPPVSDFTRSKA